MDNLKAIAPSPQQYCRPQPSAEMLDQQEKEKPKPDLCGLRLAPRFRTVTIRASACCIRYAV